MALRGLLVALVVGLGVDLPGGDEVAAWARSGRDWVQSRVDGVLGVEVAAAPEAADAEFAAIVDQMAGAFANDLASARRPAFEPIAVAEEAEPGVAFALNREAQGEGRTPEPASAEVVGPVAPSAGGVARLASAVRLTRQAADAWWAVLGGVGSTVAIR